LGVKIWETLAGHGLSLADLWEHSALVGAAARLISHHTRVGEPEEVFTAGLLHDMGRAILNPRLPTQERQGGARTEGTLLERERGTFGIDHAQAGAWLAEAWALPTTIVESAARHHEPIVAGRLTTPAIVNLANRLVHWTDLDAGAIDPEAERLLADD